MNLQNLLAENIGLLLFAALTTFSVLTVWAARNLFSTTRQFKGKTKTWFAVGWAVVYLVICAAGLFFFGSGVVAMGPGLLEQHRITGSPAPALDYTRLADSKEGHLADHQGKVVLVNLWATWCPPCRAEMPALERLHQTYGEDGLVVINISDEERDRISAYLKNHPMTTEHGHVEEMPWPAPGRPTSYVIDRDGVVRKSIIGERDFETFETLVQEYL